MPRVRLGKGPNDHPSPEEQSKTPFICLYFSPSLQLSQFFLYPFISQSSFNKFSFLLQGRSPNSPPKRSFPGFCTTEAKCPVLHSQPPHRVKSVGATRLAKSEPFQQADWRARLEKLTSYEALSGSTGTWHPAH